MRVGEAHGKVIDARKLARSQQQPKEDGRYERIFLPCNIKVGGVGYPLPIYFLYLLRDVPQAFKYTPRQRGSWGECQLSRTPLSSNPWTHPSYPFPFFLFHHKPSCHSCSPWACAPILWSVVKVRFLLCLNGDITHINSLLLNLNLNKTCTKPQ